jgi:hypothetical protein
MAWQTSGTKALRGPHTGERLDGLTDSILVPNALAPQLEWAFRCGQYPAGLGTRGLKNGAQASGAQRP